MVCVRINVKFVISLTILSHVPEYPGIFPPCSLSGAQETLLWPTNRREPVACDQVTMGPGAKRERDTETQP